MNKVLPKSTAEQQQNRQKFPPNPSQPNQKGQFNDGVTNLDIMGQNFQLGFPTRTKKLQTNLGAIATIFTTLLCVGAFLLVFMKFFDTQSPVVTNSVEFSPETLTYDLYGKAVLSPISVSLNSQFVQNNMNRYITVKAKLIHSKFNLQTDFIDTQVVKEFLYVPCSTISDPTTLEAVEEIIPDSNLKVTFLCPDFQKAGNNLTLTSDPRDSSTTTLEVRVFPCSLADTSQCAPASELEGLGINYLEVSNLVSPSNFKNPITQKSQFSSMLLDLKRAKSLSYGLKFKKVIDDRWHIRGATERGTYAVPEKDNLDSWQRDPAQTTCTLSQVNEAAGAARCGEYLYLGYEINNEIEVTRRRYHKIATLLGEFGGSLKLITSLLVLMTFYNSRRVKSYLTKALFPFKDSFVKELNQKIEQEAMQKNKVTMKDPANQTSRISKKKSKKKNHVKEVTNEIINSRINGIELMHKLNFIEILQESLLDENQKLLLPLALLRAKQRQREEEEMKAQGLRPDGSQLNEVRIGQESLDGPQRRKKETKKGDGKLGMADYKQKYQALLESQPDNPLKQMFKEIMVDELKDWFDDGSGAAGKLKGSNNKHIIRLAEQDSPLNAGLTKTTGKYTLSAFNDLTKKSCLGSSSEGNGFVSVASPEKQLLRAERNTGNQNEHPEPVLKWHSTPEEEEDEAVEVPAQQPVEPKEESVRPVEAPNQPAEPVEGSVQNPPAEPVEGVKREDSAQKWPENLGEKAPEAPKE